MNSSIFKIIVKSFFESAKQNSVEINYFKSIILKNKLVALFKSSRIILEKQKKISYPESIESKN